jgi:hypothetical protein
MTPDHRPHGVIDTPPQFSPRASDAFYRDRRKSPALKYLRIILALVLAVLAMMLLGMIAGKAAANIHVTILEHGGQ